MGGKPWTDSEISLARQMILFGHSQREVAERLGRTRSGVRNILDLSRRYSAGRICSDCPKPIRNENKTGRCKSCATAYNNSLPETRQKRSNGWKKRLADPIKYARLCQTAAANSRKAMADPEKRAAAAERGRRIYATYLDTPEMRARLLDPELRKRKGRKISEHRMAWCPPEYRELYYEIRRTTEGGADEHRRIVLAQVAADKARDNANLSPFERQERALANGATLVANDIKPSLANPGVYEERRSA